MADISIIHNGNTDYNVKDAAGREALAVVENKGAKNILKTYDIPETTAGNVVFSIIDGVCSVSTTGTQTTARVLVYAMDTNVGSTTVNSRYTIPKGTYILKTTGNGKVKLRAIEHDGTNVNLLAETTGADVEFTYSGTMPYVVFTLYVSSNTSLSEAVTFIPMCCLKAEYIIDQTAVKYGKTNAELTVENASQQSEIDYAVNTGVKNLLNLSGITPTVPSDLTLTDNNDGTFSVSGTLASANSITFPIAAISGNLILSGCPSGGGESSYMLRLNKNGTAVSASTDTGSGSQIFSINGTGYALAARFAAGTYTNVTFKPMIRSAAISDLTFQPYALPNPVITPVLIQQVDEGAKNKFLLDEIGKSASTHGTVIDQNGVKYTVSADKTISVLGTATSGAWVYFWDSTTNAAKNFIEFFDGSHVVSINRGSTPIVLFYNIDNGGSVVIDDGEILPKSNGTNAVIGVQVNKNSVVDPEQTIYPMICTKTAWDISQAYVPYAKIKTNRELTVLTDEDRDALIELVDSGAKNHALENDKTGTRAFDIDVRPITGTYRLVIGQYTSTDTDTNNFAIIFDYSDGTNEIRYYPKNADINYEYTTNKYLNRIHIYASVHYVQSDGDTVSVSNLMICTAAAYAISPAFVPYRPSWQEMYDSNKLIDISSEITTESGYTLESTTHLYYKNKQVFGTIAIAINSGSYSPSLTPIAKLPVEYAPAKQYLGSCGFSKDQWAITNIGYAFIQTANASSTAQRGQISVKSPTPDLTHMILNVCYPTVT